MCPDGRPFILIRGIKKWTGRGRWFLRVYKGLWFFLFRSRCHRNERSGQLIGLVSLDNYGLFVVSWTSYDTFSMLRSITLFKNLHRTRRQGVESYFPVVFRFCVWKELERDKYVVWPFWLWLTQPQTLKKKFFNYFLI